MRVSQGSTWLALDKVIACGLERAAEFLARDPICTDLHRAGPHRGVIFESDATADEIGEALGRFDWDRECRVQWERIHLRDLGRVAVRKETRIFLGGEKRMIVYRSRCGRVWDSVESVTGEPTGEALAVLTPDNTLSVLAAGAA